MGERYVEIIRELHEAFDALGFERAREELVAGAGFEELAAAFREVGHDIAARIDPDVEVLPRLGLALPDMSGVAFRGREGWTEFWRTWLEPWDDWSFELSDLERVGAHVVVNIRIGARGRGSGVPIEVDFAQVWTLRDERIVRLEVFSDRAEALAKAQAEPHP